MKRTALPASVAIVVLVCAAAAVWVALVHAVAETIAAQARIAGGLLDANMPAGEDLARVLLRPGIHVLVVDRRSGVVVEGGGGGVHAPPAPPPDVPDGAPPGAGRPRFGPVEGVAAALARLAPVRVERGERMVEIAPDVRVLAQWLTAEVLLLCAGAAVVIVLAARRAAALAGAERAALETRAAAADRFQRFLAETGHELRTPLTVMAGYVDILRASGGAPIDERVLDGMHAETSRMRMLVEKMMTLARLESHVAVPRLVDVAAAARDAAQILQRRYPRRDVRVHAGQTASIIIDADDYAAALGNILENAVKYAPDSAVEIETAVRDGHASTAIIDRGPGIADGDRAAIFEQFVRAREDGEGLGLGLAIVKRVADRWNGSVDCQSGGGRTVFRLTFPLADEEEHVVAR